MRGFFAAALVGALLFGVPAFAGVTSSSGVCFGTVDEALADTRAQFHPVLGSDGSVTSVAAVGYGAGYCEDEECYPAGWFVETQTTVPADHPQCVEWGGGNSCVLNYQSTVIASYDCDYKGGFEYWNPILAAFFLAGVAILCSRVVYRMFHRETH